ncbi:MAG: AsmA-like C-terminal region-containing protein [Cyclobacteriaceae bacterium]|nr:MAG: AsmA-like C-terminal region-containing protein [Cyclobacteriaceae bacterium]
MTEQPTVKNLKGKRLKQLLALFILVPTLLFGILTALLYWKQDSVVQELVATLNEDFTGTLEVDDSHISPFANFPYISIDLDHVRIYEDKEKDDQPLVEVEDVYLGFDIWTLLKGTFEVKSLKFSNGTIKLIQHLDGTFNIGNALSKTKEIEDPGEEFHMDLKSIQLQNIDLLKINEANDLMLEFFINDAKSRFKDVEDHMLITLDSRFLLNIISGGDTTFVKHKHFEIHTQLDYDEVKHILTVQPSELRLERAYFKVDGSVDVDDDMNLDIRIEGNKPNFDLFLAFAPEELDPVFQRYENAGKIFFNASITGKAANGNNPRVTADFGCEDAFFNNKISSKRLDDLFFKGHFTTGDSGTVQTMEFHLLDFSAKPEAGTFSGNLKVKNFNSPEIDMQIRSEFQLDFLAQFLNITDLQDLKGEVALTMNFHDIVDLSRPERSIERLNESYFTELDVKNLSFTTPSFHLPIHDLDIKANMDGHKAIIDHFNLKVGDSDVQISASISDLPAILHHTADPVTATLLVKSNLLDIQQLTSGDTLRRKPVNEQIRDMSMKFKFNSSARAFTESPNLPVGEFFIEDLYAKLTHYPHTLHDFHADVFIDSSNFRIIDFTGMIDKSDFHFNGKLNNYDLWFLNQPLGDTKIEFNLTSDLLQLEDLFSYEGENYVPEDYRHEEFKQLKIHGFADLHFNKGLKSSDVYIDKLEAQMKVHPMRFEKFKGRIHYEEQHLLVKNFSGKLGKSEFTADLHYYSGTDNTIKKRDNHFSLKATHLDFDELFAYNPPPPNTTLTPQDHEDVFNIYDLPFTDMTFDFDIKRLNYHRYLIDDFFVKARTQKDHFIYIDSMSLKAAGGNIHLSGYMNGSDRNKIYFSPKMTVENVDLDQLLFKFENFGQDHLVSENLHGKLTGKITGKVHLHADMVPIIDDSEIQLAVEVRQGRLERYSALEALSDYFKDKNLSKVLFDTLRNQFELNNGTLSIPKMTINSSLGFIEISGKQDMSMNMEYYMRIPLKLVTQVGMAKLFGKKEDTSNQEDEIQYRDESKRIRFVNLKLTGTPDNYKISLGKDKSD